MPKVTDAQLVILSAAAQRDGGAALPLPKSLKLKGGAVTATLKGLLKKGLLAERPATHDSTAWRETKDGQRQTLVITNAGRAAIGIESDQAIETASPGTKPPPRDGYGPAKSKAKTKPKRKPNPSPSPLRSGTKQAMLVDLLKRKQGATIVEAAKATGWQPHSVRGAISGSLKKKLGLAVMSEKVEGRGRVYRITRKR